MSKKEQQLREALKRSSQALDDWINVHAPSFCDEERVAEAKERIHAGGGTLAHIADIQQQNKEALKE